MNSRFFGSLFEIFTLTACISCQRESADLICNICLVKIRRFDGQHDDFYCYGVYDGVLKNLIQQFKYQGKFSLARPLSELLFKTIPEEIHANIDALVPVPLHLTRLRTRTYNQAARLAGELSKLMDIPLLMDVLKKTAATFPQTGLSKHQRKKNVRGVFSVENAHQIAGKRLLLIDDVYTTGATALACKKILKQAGASRIAVAVLAKSC